MHCASLGEFEQGRPLIEEFKKSHPRYKILITFFSPSGYLVRNKYEYADAVVYMPADTKANAAFFIKTVNPVLAIFVKYEFWYHHLHQLHERNIKCILISATFREKQIFFKWYGGLFRKLLQRFDAIFLQDRNSIALLQKIGITGNVFIAGDTRYDRVASIAARVKKNEAVEKFAAGFKIFIAGSSWEADERILKECLSVFPINWKMIIAPHEIHPGHLEFINKLFGEEMIFYSQVESESNLVSKKILVIDNIGMLSDLYSYGNIAFVGGGFQKSGIHNILEPAIFGLPVIFGPFYQKFVEAGDLKETGFAFPIHNADECKQILKKLINDENDSQQLRRSLLQFMSSKTGATSTILKHIEQKGWV